MPMYIPLTKYDAAVESPPERLHLHTTLTLYSNISADLNQRILFSYTIAR